MRALADLLAFVFHLGVAVLCKLSERLGGQAVAGSVNELWPDVPPIPGATKVEGKLPLHMRLIMRYMAHGKVNFIAYRTEKTAQEVKDFYSVERMKAVGWTPKDKGLHQQPGTQNEPAASVSSHARTAVRKKAYPSSWPRTKSSPRPASSTVVSILADDVGVAERSSGSATS